jgi:hypothetical protein
MSIVIILHVVAHGSCAVNDTSSCRLWRHPPKCTHNLERWFQNGGGGSMRMFQGDVTPWEKNQMLTPNSVQILIFTLFNDLLCMHLSELLIQILKKYSG